MTAKAFPVPERHDIMAGLHALGLQNGDIIVRLSDTRAFGFLPFSKIVAYLSGSKWSHASVIFTDLEGEYRAVEVTDNGTIDFRLIDWLDFCVGGRFAIYRLREGLSIEKQDAIQLACHDILTIDPDYDFQYLGNDPRMEYCVGAVAHIYQKIGIEITTPLLLQDVVTRPVAWWCFKVGNALARRWGGKGFDLTRPYYFVGNDQKGLVSNPDLMKIYERL